MTWPDVVLGEGSGDAVGLLASWLLRRAFWTLLWLGAIAVVLSGTVDGPGQMAGLSDPEADRAVAVAEALAAPTTLLLLSAPAVRFVSTLLALGLAYPIARRWQTEAGQARAGGRWHPVVWFDRARLVSGLRAIRWTSSVRGQARARLGRGGRFVQVADLVLLLTGIVLFPVALVTLVTRLS